MDQNEKHKHSRKLKRPNRSFEDMSFKDMPANQLKQLIPTWAKIPLETKTRILTHPSFKKTPLEDKEFLKQLQGKTVSDFTEDEKNRFVDIMHAI